MSDFHQTWEAVRLNQTEKRLAAWVREPTEEESCLLLASFVALVCVLAHKSSNFLTWKFSYQHRNSRHINLPPATPTPSALKLSKCYLGALKSYWHHRKSKAAGRELGFSQDGGKVGSLIPLDLISQEEPHGFKCVDRQISFNISELFIM